MPEPGTAEAAVLLEAGHSHLYPGARLGGAPLPVTGGAACLVVFADGGRAGGW